MKLLMFEKHPTEPHLYLVAGHSNIGKANWTEMPKADVLKLRPVLDLIAPVKSFGIHHLYEMTDEEFEAITGVTS